MNQLIPPLPLAMLVSIVVSAARARTVWLAATDGSYAQQITTGFQPPLSRDGRSLAGTRRAVISDGL